MAVVIRMKRGGRTHAPYYRVVVIDSRSRTRGREIAQLGIYHPAARPKPVIEINVREALEWLYKGAQYSDTARTLLSKKGVLKAFAEGVKPEDIVEAPPEEASASPEEAPPAEETPAAPTDEAPAAPTDEAPAAPTDEAPAAPTDEAAVAPADEAAEAPTDEAPAAPTDEAAAAPADEESDQ